MSDPALTLRPLRRDLKWTKRLNDWLAYDPLSESYYLFDDAEHAAAIEMSSTRTAAELLEILAKRHPGIDLNWLRRLCAKLNAFQLQQMHCDDMHRMYRRHRRGRAHNYWQNWLNPLSVRLPLFNPSGLLLRFRWLANGLFHRGTVSLLVALAIVAIPLVLQRLLLDPDPWMPSFSTIQGSYWLVLGVCYLVAKSLHEIGHGLACVRQKVECNELGVMLLVFVPCLYCDTTSSWRLPSKWQRAQIAAAGIYVELWIAVLAALIWLATRDGTVHDVAGGLMWICSLSTLLVNGNPLLKYDGYYVLSDLTETPNLFDRGRSAAGHRLRSFFYRSRRGARTRYDAKWWMSVYGILSGIYRTVLLVAIVVFLWYAMVPSGLGLLAVGIAALLFFGLVWSASRRWVTIYRGSSGMKGMRYPRVVMGLGACGLIAYGVWYVPLSSHIDAPAMTGSADTQEFVATRVSILKYVATAGLPVEAGDTVIELHDPALQLELLAAEAELDRLETRLTGLSQRKAVDPSAAMEMETLDKLIQQANERIQILNDEVQQLRLKAKRSGAFVPARLAVDRGPASEALADGRFVSRLSDQRHRGLRVERGQRLGSVSDVKELELEVIVQAHEVKRIEIGTKARIQWMGHPGVFVRGCVTRIATEPINEIPAALRSNPMFTDRRLDSADQNQLSFQRDLMMSGQGRPQQSALSWFQVIVGVESSEVESSRSDATWGPPLGAPAVVRIETKSRTIAQRVWEAVRLNIN